MGSLAHPTVGQDGEAGSTSPQDADDPPHHRLASLNGVVVPPSFPRFPPASSLHHLPLVLSSPRDFPRGFGKQPPPDNNDTSSEWPQPSSTTETLSELVIRLPHEEGGQSQQMPPMEDSKIPAGQDHFNDQNQFPSAASLGGPYNLGMRYPLPSSFRYPFEKPAPAPSFLPMTGPRLTADSPPAPSHSSFAAPEETMPVEPLQNPELLANYDALIKALQVVYEVNRLRQISVLDKVDSGLRNPQSQNPVFNTTADLYFLNDAAESATKLAPKITTAISTLFTSIGEAISTFFQSIAEAISTFFQDLATAISETPAILLLGLIPLFFVLLSFFLTSGKGFGFGHHHFIGHGGGGYGGRSSSTLYLHEAEVLARFVLAQIDAFEERITSELSLEDTISEPVDSG